MLFPFYLSQEKAVSSRGIESIRRRILDLRNVLYGARLDLVEGSLDAQLSEAENVSLVISGHVTSIDGVRRPYMQFFYLVCCNNDVGQGKKYLVKNSVFRILADSKPIIAPAPVASISDAAATTASISKLSLNEEVKPESSASFVSPEVIVSASSVVTNQQVPAPASVSAKVVPEKKNVVEVAPTPSVDTAPSGPKTYASILFNSGIASATSSAPIQSSAINKKGGKDQKKSVASSSSFSAAPGNNSSSVQAATTPAAKAQNSSKIQSPAIYVNQYPEV
jgi:hypothetical protein